MTVKYKAIPPMRKTRLCLSSVGPSSTFHGIKNLYRCCHVPRLGTRFYAVLDDADLAYIVDIPVDVRVGYRSIWNRIAAFVNDYGQEEELWRAMQEHSVCLGW